MLLDNSEVRVTALSRQRFATMFDEYLERKRAPDAADDPDEADDEDTETEESNA